MIEIPSLEPYSAIIVLGGSSSANDETPAMQAEIHAVQEALRTGLPLLGICLGHQVLGRAAGAEVTATPMPEVGFRDGAGVPYTVSITDFGSFDPLFDGVKSPFRVFQLHGEAVQPSDEIEVLATGEHCEVQAIHVGRRAYGLQMHIEVTPDMLSTWASEDPDLANVSAESLQEELALIADEYNLVGRRVLTNFLSLCGLASSVEVNLDEADVR